MKKRDDSDGEEEACLSDAAVVPNTSDHPCLPKNRLSHVLRSIEDMKRTLGPEDCITDKSGSLASLLLETEDCEDDPSQKHDLQSLALATAGSMIMTSDARTGPFATTVDVFDLVTESLRMMSVMSWKADDADLQLDSDEEDELKDSIHLSKVRWSAKHVPHERGA